MADDREALKARFAARVPSQAIAPAELSPNTDVFSEPATTTPMPPGFDRIQLKIRRTQAKGLVGGVGFSIHVVAELSPAAHEAVKRYRLGDAILYQKQLVPQFTDSVIVMIWRVVKLWFTKNRWRITVNDLVRGRKLTAKNVIDMLEIEADLRKAADMFAQVLRAAAWFGGEEIIEL